MSERVDRLKERIEKSQRYKKVVVDEGCIEDALPTEWVAPDPNLLTAGEFNREVSSGYVAMSYKDLLQNDRTYKAMHMRAMVKKWTSVDISYRTAWREMEKALEEIQGSFGQSYQLLNTYSKELRKVDRFSFTEQQRVGNTDRFKCYLWSYGITVRSFRHTCRPHTEIDDTHFRGRSRGCLISAIVVDGDNHVFPVTFGLVSGEDNENYDWFLHCLGDQVVGATGLVRANITKALEFTHSRAGTGEYLIKTYRCRIFRVNLENRVCSCGYFQHMGIPCAHACKAISVSHQACHMTYVDSYYSTANWQRCYREVWVGIPSKEQCDIDEEEERVLPPPLKRKPGWISMKRMKIRAKQSIRVQSVKDVALYATWKGTTDVHAKTLSMTRGLSTVLRTPKQLTNVAVYDSNNSDFVAI
ncbi:hypothetical protein IFM89_002409 [Coptis chinensis]|uniref:SWIM-type domain-containing protein n=1 Tax=Coptis chinensis TaxID=261450 RepID=A0A835M9G2_9MAGN|nr:hypothetical protein IFM89_002409 [Coptis chinensis]